MKKILSYVVILFVFSSCIFFPFDIGNGGNNSQPIQYSKYKAVTMKRVDFEKSINLKTASPTKNSGKIYIFDNLIFINEKNRGFHVFDNTTPSNPKKIAFINAPGSTDLAIKNNSIYINQARDLIAVSYDKTIPSVNVSKRIVNVFPSKISPDGYSKYVKDDEVIIDWVLK